MNEMDFRLWLLQQGADKKVISDMISRLKRLEREFNYCDIDAEYHQDRCSTLLSYFRTKGINAQMKALNTSLPIGRYQLNTYKYALRKYIAFLTETTSNEQ